MEIIIGRQGNQKTPITDPTVSRRHCKVTVNNDGSYILENLSPSGTKVDGVEIIRRKITGDCKIQLGLQFSAKLSELIGEISTSQQPRSNVAAYQSADKPANIARKQDEVSKKEVKAFNISHLRRVWEDYNRTNIEMADEQRKINLTRTGLGIFTMCAMPTIFFFGAVGYVLTGIGVLGNIYSFVGMKNAETAEDRQRRQDEFDDAWICPNPDCGHSLLAKNYRMLVRNHQSCPYCKCKYVER